MFQLEWDQHSLLGGRVMDTVPIDELLTERVFWERMERVRRAMLTFRLQMGRALTLSGMPPDDFGAAAMKQA